MMRFDHAGVATDDADTLAEEESAEQAGEE